MSTIKNVPGGFTVICKTPDERSNTMAVAELMGRGLCNGPDIAPFKYLPNVWFCITTNEYVETLGGGSHIPYSDFIKEHLPELK